MVDQTAIRTAADRLAALDFSAENAEIARLKADIEECNHAARRGEARRAEISVLLSSNEAGMSGAAVASQLLAGAEDLGTLSRSRDNLVEERDALQRGMRDLAERSRVAASRIASVRAGTKRRLREEISDLGAALRQEAEEAAVRIMACYAAYRAISVATDIRGADYYAIEAAAEGLTGTPGHHGLIPHGQYEVPREIVELISATKNMGDAVDWRQITQIKV